MVNDLSQSSVAWHDVPLYYFLKIVKDFITDAELVSNGGTSWLLTFLNVNVDNVTSVELPSESQIVWSS